MAIIPGWQPLIVCDGVDPPCNIGSVIELIKNGIADLVLISTLLVVVALVISGFRLLTSFGKPKALEETKTMFSKIVIGYGIILTAWVVVYTITSVLLKPEFNFFLSK